MGNNNKTKEQLLKETDQLRVRIAELEKSDNERIRAEEALQNSETRFNEAQRLTQIGSWELDLVTNTLYWSNEIYRMFNMDPKQFGATYEAFLDNIHPDDRDLVNKAYTESVKNKKPYNIVHRLLLKDGTLKFVNERCETFYDDQGNAIRSLGTVQDITWRKEAEEKIQRKTAVVEAINKIFHETLVCDTAEEVAYTCINIAEELTGSKNGLVGEVNEEGRFDTASYGDLGWGICKMPEADSIMLSKNMIIRGIWGQAILKGESQIVNNPASHPKSVGIPEGHPQIECFMGVPLKHAGETIGMIGLANKEGGYTHADQELVEALSVAFVEALHRKQAEEELKKYREYLEEMVKKRTKELEEKNKELDSALKVFVGKKLTIKNLQNRIEELEGK
jgi:PAS domain S-box-containing protein